MFFGLGPGELLIIAAIIVLIAGPKALGKIVKTAKRAHDAKSKLTSGAALDYLIKDDEPTDGSKKKGAKAKSERDRDAS